MQQALGASQAGLGMSADSYPGASQAGLASAVGGMHVDSRINFQILPLFLEQP